MGHVGKSYDPSGIEEIVAAFEPKRVGFKFYLLTDYANLGNQFTFKSPVALQVKGASLTKPSQRVG